MLSSVASMWGQEPAEPWHFLRVTRLPAMGRENRALQSLALSSSRMPRMFLQQSTQTWQIAERQFAVRDLGGARRNYERLLGDQSFRAMAHLRLSQVASSQGRHRDSVEQAIAAFNA